uniref:Ribosome binding protein 1a n=1 Tax=Sinocyclocheilus rhinocerous TaxID=307959 RepID=A0A673LKN2_9TELE
MLANPESLILFLQTNWLQDFAVKAQEEIMGKLQAAQESQCTLQSECEQYRSVLAETEGMLKTLQKSVEEEEKVWKTQIMESEEKLRMVGLFTVLTHTHKSADIYGLAITYLLGWYCWFGQVQAQLEQTLEKLQGEQALNQQLSAEVEQVQWCSRSCVSSRFLKTCYSLNECLEKERKMTKDLGQAATKLQQLLRNSQDQLSKEKEQVRTLQDQLRDEGDGELKQGTSV